MNRSQLNLMSGALNNSGSGKNEFAKELAFDLVERLTRIADDQSRPGFAREARKILDETGVGRGVNLINKPATFDEEIYQFAVRLFKHKSAQDRQLALLAVMGIASLRPGIRRRMRSLSKHIKREFGACNKATRQRTCKK